jgi:hypothetical protein
MKQVRVKPKALPRCISRTTVFADVPGIRQFVGDQLGKVGVAK